MSEEKKPILSGYLPIIITLLIVVSSLVFIEVITTAEVKIPVPCSIIMSDAIPTPDNVITKGYDVLRNQTGFPTPDQAINEKDSSIFYDCYYIKDAGVLQKIIFNWQLR